MTYDQHYKPQVRNDCVMLHQSISQIKFSWVELKHQHCNFAAKRCECQAELCCLLLGWQLRGFSCTTNLSHTRLGDGSFQPGAEGQWPSATKTYTSGPNTQACSSAANAKSSASAGSASPGHCAGPGNSFCFWCYGYP